MVMLRLTLQMLEAAVRDQEVSWAHSKSGSHSTGITVEAWNLLLQELTN